jgi:hypothetical protein
MGIFFWEMSMALRDLKSGREWDGCIDDEPVALVFFFFFFRGQNGILGFGMEMGVSP